jgi:hypothetical protein
VTRRAPGPKGRDPKEFWEDKIEKHEGDKGEEEEDKSAPDLVTGVGEKAIWAGTSVHGALYVLKGKFHGPRFHGHDERACSAAGKRAIALARLVLQRL